MQRETLELKARRYAIAISTGNGNKVVLPAESYAIGNILITSPAVLYEQLKAWQEFRRNPPQDLHTLLFKLERTYFIQTPEKARNGKYKIRKKNLLDISPFELRFALLRRLYAEKQSYNLWKVGGVTAVQKDERNSGRPYTGTAMLTGKVKSMQRGGRGNVPTRYSVNVTNPFDIPEGFYCGCEDERWTDAKEGLINVEGACTHTAALQTYAKENPTTVRNLLRGSRLGHQRFVLPFHFEETQSHNLARYGISPEGIEHLSSQRPDLSHLKMDVLVDHLFNDSTYFDIGKKLLLIPEIYDPALLAAVFHGEALYEIVLQGPIKRDIEFAEHKDIERMFKEMAGLLMRKGFVLRGYALEFKGTEWETVCMNYEKGDKSVRILFNERFPPIFVYRKAGPNGSKNPFLVEKFKHPYSYLFERGQGIDDRTKQVTSLDVRIPMRITMPHSLRSEYRRTIAENFEGGIEGLSARIRVMGIPGNEQLARWLSY